MAEAKSELKDWDDQYKFQFQTEAGANNRPKEEKTNVARRLNLARDDEEEEDESGEEGDGEETPP